MAQVAARAMDALDETEVRRLCGDAAFARADLLQRGGRVLDPTVQGSTLRASVQGIWRRLDQVEVGERGGTFVSTCSCRGGSFCPHAGTLLLHWIRNRPSFAPARRAEESAAAPTRPSEEAPAAELARYLEQDSLPHLREMARLRGLKGKGRSKGELAAYLAEVLSTPSGIDQGLAALNEDARLELDALHLVGAVGSATEEEIGVAYSALGGSGEAYVGAHLDLGLVVAEPRVSYARARYRVPRVVAARLPVRRDLARPIDETLLAVRGEIPTPRRGPRLGIAELLLVVAQEIVQSGIKRRPSSRDEEMESRYVPSGWRIDPAEYQEGATLRDLLSRRRRVRLLPLLSLLSRAELQLIAVRTGQRVAATALAVHLLADLDILWGTDRLLLREDRMQALLDAPPADRLAAVSGAWLGMGDWSELEMVVGSTGPLQIHYSLSGYVVPLPLLGEAVLLRRLVARTLGRMAPGVWYDFRSFLDLVVRLAPGLMAQPASPLAADGWRISKRGRPGETAADEGSPDPALLREALVLALLAGPLSWLGLVEVAILQDQSPVFRVRPQAGVLAGRDVPEDRAEAPGGVVVSPDLTVLVPAGTPRVELHALLSQAGELAEASSQGLRYRLTPDRVQGLFESGVTGSQLARALADRSEGGLPEAAAATLERWWADYGSLRLYDDLTLLELADDYLLPELLAATSLRSALIHAFSPRLIAVEPKAAPGLVAEMARLGHAPRLVEEG